MTRKTAGLDRLIVFVVGLVVLLVGVWAALWAFEVPVAHQISDTYRPEVLHTFLNSQWFPATLLLIAVITAVAGIWLLLANLRRHSFNQVTTLIGADDGHVSIATARLASALGQQLQRNPDVTTVQSTLREDRGRPTITWTIHSKPSVRMPQLIEEIEQAEQDLRLAIPEVDLDSRYLVQLRPVETS